MQEILLYYPEIRNIRPSAKIGDLHLIKEIAYRFGYKIRPATPPDVEEKQEIVCTFRYIWLGLVLLWLFVIVI